MRNQKSIEAVIRFSSFIMALTGLLCLLAITSKAQETNQKTIVIPSNNLDTSQVSFIKFNCEIVGGVELTKMYAKITFLGDNVVIYKEFNTPTKESDIKVLSALKMHLSKNYIFVEKV